MKRKKDTRQKRNKMFFGVLVSILMITSIGGFLIGGNSSSNGIKVTIEDKEFTYFPSQNSYKVYSDLIKENVDMFFLPDEIEYIDVPKAVGRKIFGSPSVVITYNPDEIDLSYQNTFRFQMNNDFLKVNKYIENGVLNSTTLEDLPIITCQEATPQKPVIVLRNSNVTKVYENQDCIFIEANNVEYFKIRDKIAYYLFGLIRA